MNIYNFTSFSFELKILKKAQLILITLFNM